MIKHIFASLAVLVSACVAAPASAQTAPVIVPLTAPLTVVVNTNVLNVRQQPDLNAAIIGKVTRGQSLSVDAKTKDNRWWRTSLNGQPGFVLAQYTVAPGRAKPGAKPPAGTGATPVFPGFDFGAHFRDAGILPRMRNEAGMGWAKYQIVMEGGAPDISGIVNAAHGSGIKLLIGAVGNRGRAGDATYHKEFASQMANLAAQGADALEVWNEPNLDREYGGSGRGQVNPENYANMLREAYGAIKSVRPDVIVISGATAPTGYFGGNCTNAGCDDGVFVQRLAAAGAGAWLDCVGAHHNGTMVGPDQSSGAPVGSADHSQWYFQGTLAVNVNAFGGKKPVCWTELGYVTKDGIAPALPGGFSWGNNITLQNQTDWLRRAVELSRASSRVWIMIIWNADFRQFDDDPQAGYSIFRPDGTCPACGGLKAVSGR